MSDFNRYGEGSDEHGYKVVACATPRIAAEQLKLDDERGWSDAPEDECMFRAVLERGAPLAWLPHQCSQWTIGGPGEVRRMIADLQAALVRMEAGS